VLVEVGPKHGEFVDAMQQQGINLRDRSHDPSCKGCIRVTIGTAEQNAVLLETFQAVAAELGIGRKVSA
jgi:histidinol-phosphate/aromatic aminotransferase/cobyric acid decarboxylase-like protein